MFVLSLHVALRCTPRYAAEYFTTLKEVNHRAQQALLEENKSRAEDGSKSIAEITCVACLCDHTQVIVSLLADYECACVAIYVCASEQLIPNCGKVITSCNTNAYAVVMMSLTFVLVIVLVLAANAPLMSPAVAKKQHDSQYDWFVKENAKLAMSKFRDWIETDAGKCFMDVASQHHAAVDAARIRKVSAVSQFCVSLSSDTFTVTPMSTLQVTVKRNSASEPLCVHLSFVEILPLFKAVKKSYLKVEDCFQVRSLLSWHSNACLI